MSFPRNGDAMRSAYWTVVTQAGKLNPAPGEIDKMEGALGELDPAAVYDAILGSRVYTLALQNLKPLRGHGNAVKLLTLLENLQEEENERRKLALPETLAVLAHAFELGVHVIKGLPLRERYADPELRHTGDIDLHVAEWSLAARFAAWLRDRGWQWDSAELPWLKWTEDGHIYGQLSLVIPDNSAPVNRVDLHIGPYSVAHAALMPLVGWEESHVLGVKATVPSRETSIALIAAHAVNDGVLSMKDINDLHVLRDGQPDPDWASVIELARSAGAVPALRQLLTLTACVYQHAESPDDRVPEYLADSPESAKARARRVARFTFHDERSRGANLLHATLLARQARRYFSAQLTPRLGGPPIGNGPHEAAGRNICWRLAPEEVWDSLLRDTVAKTPPVAAPIVESSLGPDLRLMRWRNATVIRMGRDIFTPTVWGPITAESAALAAQLREVA
jgi:hypothetical protein